MLMDPRAYVRRRRSRAQEPGGGGGEAPDGLRRGNGLAAAAAAALAAVLALPVARNLLLLPALSTGPAHHRSDHPPSPYSPPLHRLDHDQVAAFRRDGMLVLRQVLPPDLMRKMEAGGDDLMEGRSRHCEMTRFTGPPIFHGYDRYCGRPHLVHDYFRDVVYRSPFAHVAAQLMGVDDGGGGVAVAAGGGSTDADVDADVDVDADAEASEEGGGGRIIRQFGDTFMAGTRIPRRWHSDYLAFQRVMRDTTLSGDGINCRDGLVVWMPLETSHIDRGGMIFLNGTSGQMADRFRGDPVSARRLVHLHSWVRDLDKEAGDLVAPRLELGDAVLFDMCTVHSSSGSNPDGVLRRAYQLRYVRNFAPTMWFDGNGSNDSMILSGPPVGKVPGATMPQVWPTTLEEEDEARAEGPIIFTRGEWLERLWANPIFTVITSSMAVKVAMLGDHGDEADANSILGLVLRAKKRWGAS